MMDKLVANSSAVAPLLCPSGLAKIKQDRRLQASRSFVTVPPTRPRLSKGVLTISLAQQRKAGICASSLNARCAAEQTQTVTRQSSKISTAPFQGTKAPKLDDGGTGSPPKDREGGGGGGGGDGSDSSGGFFLFGFLLFLSYLRDQEDEASNGAAYG